MAKNFSTSGVGPGNEGWTWRRPVKPTNEYVANPDYREPDRFGATPGAEEGTTDIWRKRHVGYGQKDVLAEEWTKTKKAKIDPNHYSVEGTDPGATPKHQRGAYGFAHITRGETTMGKRYVTMGDPDNPMYEYQKMGSVRPWSDNQDEAPGGEPTEAGGQMQAQPQLARPRTPFNRMLTSGGAQSGGGPLPTVMGELGPGPLALGPGPNRPFPSGPGEPQRTEEGAIPMPGAPGFNVGGQGQSNRQRRRGMNPRVNFGSIIEQTHQVPSALEQREYSYWKTGNPGSGL
jgi:hypothetical protein